MTPLHPNWHSTDDERSVPVRATVKAETVPVARPQYVSVSRRPAALVGIALVLGAGAFYFNAWDALIPTGQIVEPTEILVRIDADGFTPATVTAVPGQTITWENMHDIPHILQSDDLCSGEDACLYTKTVFPGERASFTIPATLPAGTYTYGSTTAEFTGTVTVEVASIVSEGSESSAASSAPAIEPAVVRLTDTGPSPSTVLLAPGQSIIFLHDADPLVTFALSSDTLCNTDSTCLDVQELGTGDSYTLPENVSRESGGYSYTITGDDGVWEGAVLVSGEASSSQESVASVAMASSVSSSSSFESSSSSSERSEAVVASSVPAASSVAPASQIPQAVIPRNPYAIESTTTVAQTTQQFTEPLHTGAPLSSTGKGTSSLGKGTPKPNAQPTTGASTILFVLGGSLYGWRRTVKHSMKKQRVFAERPL